MYGYLVKPFREQDIVPAIETARARHEELDGCASRGRLALGGARRAQGDRAREGAVDGERKLSEADAFARLRKASQVSGRPLRVIAEAVIDTLDPS